MALSSRRIGKSGCLELHSFAGQHGGLLHAIRELRIVELVVFAYVEKARAFYLAATGRERSVAPPHHGESSTRRAGSRGDPRQNPSLAPGVTLSL
jgi:hypothetical protein